jgi:hypothetical protein
MRLRDLLRGIEFVGAWIISVFSYGSRWLAVERGCPAEQSDFWLFVGTAGQREVF